MKYFFIIFGVFLLLFTTISSPQQDTPSIELSDSTWNKRVLQALIITSENESWWQPSCANMSLNAIDQWNEAFQYFAAKYPEYAYLSHVSIATEVSNETKDGYDIYVSFTDSVLISDEDALGLTYVSPEANRTIQKCTIKIAVKSEAIGLTSSDQRDVLTHELGHALGLGHCNSTGDLMYPSYDLLSTDNAISTLDLYGVAMAFRWILWQGYPVAFAASEQAVSLPSSVAFEYAPVLDPAPKTLSDNPVVKFLQIMVSQPAILVMMITLSVFAVFAYGIYKSREKYLRSIKNHGISA